MVVDDGALECGVAELARWQTTLFGVQRSLDLVEKGLGDLLMARDCCGVSTEMVVGARALG